MNRFQQRYPRRRPPMTQEEYDRRVEEAERGFRNRFIQPEVEDQGMDTIVAGDYTFTVGSDNQPTKNVGQTRHAGPSPRRTE